MNRRLAGLCTDCLHHRLVDSGRSTFVLCQRGLVDPAYRKYPPLPVLSCSGYEPSPPTDPGRSDQSAGGKLTE